MRKKKVAAKMPKNPIAMAGALPAFLKKKKKPSKKVK
jgi:hypothetical protein